MSENITIELAGSAVVTDLGRTRGPRFGLPVNGALDQYSAQVANVLVGNPTAVPLIEVTALDFRFRTESDLLIAVTGAVMSVTVNGLERPQWEPISVRAGDSVALGGMTSGLRAYVAVHGSFDVPFLLGSCAPDTVIGFGIRLAASDMLTANRSVAPLSNPHFNAALYSLPVHLPPLAEVAKIDVTDGPDVADFGDTGGRLFSVPYTVGANSNHIGLRLAGPLPVRESTTELVSRGVPVGAVEVPPGQELLVLHRGRGVTAGYPVLAVVTSVSLNTLAQVRPGQKLVFRRVDLDTATQLARAERDHVLTLRARVNSVFSSLGESALADNSPPNKGNLSAVL